MSKAPSAETLLREARSENKRQLKLLNERSIEISRLKLGIANARGSETQARQEAAEWRKRFDDLLARVPVARIEGEETK